MSDQKPTIEEISGWMMELSEWFKSIASMSGMTCTNDLNLKRAELWKNRAVQVASMGSCCEQGQCKCCVAGYGVVYDTCALDEGRPDDCSLTASGKIRNREQCEHWRIPTEVKK